MHKPAGCSGCPLYGDGRGFVPDELRDGAAVLIVGQNPGVEEEEQGRPFVGKTGQMMEKYLRDAGLTRDEVSIANALRCRYRGSNDLPPITQTITKDALRHCWSAHGRIPDGTKLIVAQGDYAAVTLTGGSVGDWRGYLRPLREAQAGISEPWVSEPHELPVLLTVHLARLFREPALTLPTRLDWAKIPKILKRTWPRKPPAFRTEPPEVWPEVFAFDTEFWHEDGAAPTSARLIRWSASWGTGDGETCVVEADSGHHPRQPASRPRVITQYAPADVHHLARLSNVSWDWSSVRVNDPSAIPPGQQHGERGNRALNSVWDSYLIEDTVWKHAVLWSDHPHDLNYLGSIYSSFNRWKHLGDHEPILYSGLDAVGLLEVDQALERELEADPLSRSVWRDIDRPALRHFVTAQYHGLRTHPARVNEVVSMLQSQATEATLRAQAIAGWPVNLASNPQVAHRLYEVEGIKPARGALGKV